MGKPSMADQYEAILLAAGSSERFKHPQQKNKLLMPLASRPVFDHSLRILLNDEKCLKIWFVVNADNQVFIKEDVKKRYKEIPHKINWVHGGLERQDSVSLALGQIEASNDKKVIIHDAARPFLTQELIQSLVDQGKGWVAVTFGIPAKDSMKRVKDSVVIKSLYRPEVWHIQTPQLFDCDVLIEAMKKAEKEHFYGNEETELVERLGYPVKVITGAEDNFKLTTGFDYQVAKTLKESRDSATERE